MKSANLSVVTQPFANVLAQQVWQARYRWLDEGGRGDRTLHDSWHRVSRAVASVEPPVSQEHWHRRFLRMLEDFCFLPAGRILAGAGTTRGMTLFNCFVIGTVEPTPAGVARARAQSATTLRHGGGIGVDFSALPSRAGRSGTGPVPDPLAALEIWEALCAEAEMAGARRGAMMATLRCDHPDVAAFVAAKSSPGSLSHFNLSVLVTESFLDAVRRDGAWQLGLPYPGGGPAQTIPARRLWGLICENAYRRGEPGVLFIDRINARNNLGYREHISATNPCGEVPLPAMGACNLGSINLARLVRFPFSAGAALDWRSLRQIASDATRFLDNVIDISPFPLPEQQATVRQTRRLGLGITGLADALALLGIHYDSSDGRALAARIMRVIALTAYGTSVALAREKGAFPALDTDAYQQAPFVRRLPAVIREGIARHGIRNSHLCAVAPAGSISLLAGNVSSGVEPIFQLEQLRRISLRGGEGVERRRIPDWAYSQWRARSGPHARLPVSFVSALELPPSAHLRMQAAVQAWVDNAVSKTINLPPESGHEDTLAQDVFMAADRLGLKGCTVFRPEGTGDSVLACGARAVAARRRWRSRSEEDGTDVCA